MICLYSDMICLLLPLVRENARDCGNGGTKKDDFSPVFVYKARVSAEIGWMLEEAMPNFAVERYCSNSLGGG